MGNNLGSFIGLIKVPIVYFDNISPIAFSALGLIVMAALLLDHFLGEPRSLHPLVGFGCWANYLQKKSRYWTGLVFPSFSARSVCLSGFVAWAGAIIPIALCTVFLFVWLQLQSLWLWFIGNTVVLYLTIAGNSLVAHANAIYKPLQQGNIALAREKVGLIVSRESSNMNEQQITSATVESVLENGNDALFAALFWFVIAGAPGAVIFRMVNTLDAMWGYKNERYRDFGFTAARMDDLLGWVPARLSALTYAIQGNFGLAIKCWKEQAHQCASPNGGVVMCAGAGALNTKIGGPAIYHGIYQDKIYMGCGVLADYSVIPKANKLVLRGAWIWVLVLLLINIGCR